MQKPEKVEVYDYSDVEDYMYKTYNFNMLKFWEDFICSKFGYDPDPATTSENERYFLLTDKDLRGDLTNSNTLIISKILSDFNQQKSTKCDRFVRFIIRW